MLSVPTLRQRLAAGVQEFKTESEKRAFFYNNVTDQEKAEFINGEFILRGPETLVSNEVGLRLLMALDGFVCYEKLGLVGFNRLTVRLWRNDYQPDISFFDNAKAKDFKPEQDLFPAPDLVAELLSDETENICRVVKMDDYALHGVKEYWLVEPKCEFLEQYFLEQDTYYLFKVHRRGDTVNSGVLKGLQLPINAIFNDNANTQYRKQFF